MFEVTRYEHPCILVRSRRTGETYKFLVGDDGALADDHMRTDLSAALRTAIAFLACNRAA